MPGWFHSKIEGVEEISALVWPTFVEVDGCIIRASSYSDETFATWQAAHSAEPWRIEAVLNEVHLYDWVDSDYDSAQLPRLEGIANRIAESWRASLVLKFPERRFTVTYETEPDAYGPTLSFHQSDHCPGCVDRVEEIQTPQP